MNNYMDIEKITKNNEKINMYINEESFSFDDIRDNMNNLNICLDIKESSNIENIQFEILRKLNMIKKIHNNNHTIIEKNINKYIDASIMTNKIFNNIDVGGYNE